MEKLPIIAAIDLGTNSFHMVIARINKTGSIQILSREKEMVRLGSSGKDMKFLTPESIERGLSTLYSFSKIAETFNAQIRAVATSAVREASNKNIFIQRAKDELNIDIEVVSGVEEGRLIFLGVIHGLPIADKRILIIDIGGGSTETIIGEDNEIDYVHSEKIGSIRLTKLFFANGKYNSKNISDARKYVRGDWMPILNKINSLGFEKVVGTSGTITSLASIVLALKDSKIPDFLNGITVSSEEIMGVIKLITNCKNSDEIKQIPGVEAKRSDIILAGSLILEAAIEELEIQEFTISPYAMREGILYDCYSKIQNTPARLNIPNFRNETISNLALRYNVLDNHSNFVSKISLELFEATRSIHKLGNYEKDIMHYSSLLHDIGYWISHDQHHKHSYYIITHSDLPGFTNDETELIGTITRYHRKSLPKKTHTEFANFSPKTQYIIKVLSGILRIAEGIDRRQRQYVKDIKCCFSNFVEIKSRLEIELIPETTKASIDIEKWGANRRKDLLEKVLNIDIKFY